MKFKLNDIEKFKHLDLYSKLLVDGFITGLHKSPYHGFSVEFSEHRQYNTGDDIKNVDWKVFARTDKLFVKRFEEETNLRAHIVIDSSSSMYYPENNWGKLRFSAVCAASIMTILQKQRDAFSLITFNNSIEYQSQCKTTNNHKHNQISQLQLLIDNKNSNKTTSTASVLNMLANKIPKRGLVILFSDLFATPSEKEDLFYALQHLKHQKHEVIIFHVYDKQTELDFEFENRPYIFKDLETSEEIKVQASELRNYYTKAIHNYFLSIENQCNKYKIDFIKVNIQSDFEKVLLTYLTKRKKMR